MTVPTIPIRFIDIRKTKSRWPLKRPQQYYFVILSAGNLKPTAVSSMYTNRQDCVDEAVRIGSGDTTFILRQHEQGDVVLRYSDLIQKTENYLKTSRPVKDNPQA